MSAPLVEEGADLPLTVVLLVEAGLSALLAAAVDVLAVGEAAMLVRLLPGWLAGLTVRQAVQGDSGSSSHLSSESSYTAMRVVLPSYAVVCRLESFQSAGEQEAAALKCGNEVCWIAPLNLGGGSLK